MKIYACSHCHFKTKEKNKLCPICQHKMEQQEGEIKYNPSLPQILKNDNHGVAFSYYCSKCKKNMPTYVCIECNNIGNLYIEYNGKKAVINRINRLSEVYTSKEVDEIALLLTDEEKYWLYHNFEDAYSFFYKRDKVKSIACFILGFVMFALCFLLGASYVVEEMIFVSYIALSVGYGCLFIFGALGIWYLIDASNIEFKGIQLPIMLFACISMVCFLLTAIIFELTFIGQLAYGFIYSVLGAIAYIIYWLVKGKKK